MVEEMTGMKWSNIYQQKDDIVEPMCSKFHTWKQAGVPVKMVRCDNAGENKKVEERSMEAQWKLGIKFEYTARDTPQQNSLAEVGFTTIANQGRAMMIGANLPPEVRYKLFREAFSCATMLDWLVVVHLDGETKTRVEHWCSNLPAWAKALRTWGEAGVVKIKTNTTPKLANKGITCMFVGYAINHADGVYRMWHPKTNKVRITRDVTWLMRMYYAAQENLPEITVGISNEVRESEDEQDDKTYIAEPTNKPDAQPAFDDSILQVDEEDQHDTNLDATTTPALEEAKNANEGGGFQTFTETRSGRVVQPPQRLNMATMALTPAEIGYQARLMELAKLEHEIAGVGAGIGGGFTNTRELKAMKYKEAMKVDTEGWTKAVEEEHDRMIKNNVWCPVKLSQVPSGAKILTSTWACKLKSNGRKRAWLNGRGYEQIDGLHYDSTSIHAPVTNETSVRIVLVLALMADWIGRINDVKGAFL
jgi:hypothetical protein